VKRLTMKELLMWAREEHIAIGAFNIFNYISTKAAIDAANNLNTPILLQTSVGTVKKFGAQALFDMMDLLRRNSSVQIVFHLDHCTDVALAKQCVDIGWDSVMIDLSAKPIEENIFFTKEVKQYANHKGVCVEGELGIIAGVEEDISAKDGVLVEYDNCIRYVTETGIDAFAPAIGTAHGMYEKEVKLNYHLITQLTETNETPIVIHGGTGLSDQQFLDLIQCGASKINVSTALKYAYIDSIRAYVQKENRENNPIKLDNAAEMEVRKVVEEHIARFRPWNNLKN